MHHSTMGELVEARIGFFAQIMPNLAEFCETFVVEIAQFVCQGLMETVSR